MVEVKTCVVCGKLFISSNYRGQYGTQKYCSKECYRIAQKGLRVERGDATGIGYSLKKCIRCGEDFKPNCPTQKYCKKCKTIVEKEYPKQYYLAHPEHTKQWRKDNPEKAKEINLRQVHKHRNLGFIPLNSYHKGWEFHHQDENYGNYMPEEAHRSIPHNIYTGKGMDAINALAFNYLGG